MISVNTSLHSALERMANDGIKGGKYVLVKCNNTGKYEANLDTFSNKIDRGMRQFLHFFFPSDYALGYQIPETSVLTKAIEIHYSNQARNPTDFKASSDAFKTASKIHALIKHWSQDIYSLGGYYHRPSSRYGTIELKEDFGSMSTRIDTETNRLEFEKGKPQILKDFQGNYPVTYSSIAAAHYTETFAQLDPRLSAPKADETLGNWLTTQLDKLTEEDYKAVITTIKSIFKLREKQLSLSHVG